MADPSLTEVADRADHGHAGGVGACANVSWSSIVAPTNVLDDAVPHRHALLLAALPTLRQPLHLHITLAPRLGILVKGAK